MPEITPQTVTGTLGSGLMAALPGGIIGAAGGLLQTGVNALFNRSYTSQQKKLIDYQYQKDLDMWNRQNEYNSPLAQMERFRAAGLNPNLIYGATSSGGNASSMPSYGTPDIARNHLDANPMNDTFNTMVSLARTSQELKSAKLDNERKKLENFYLVDSLWYQNEALKREYNWQNLNFDKVKQAELDSMMARLGLMGEQASLARSQKNVANARVSLLNKDLETYDARNLLDGNFFLNTPFIRGRISPMKLINWFKQFF